MNKEYSPQLANEFYKQGGCTFEEAVQRAIEYEIMNKEMENLRNANERLGLAVRHLLPGMCLARTDKGWRVCFRTHGGNSALDKITPEKALGVDS